MNVAVSDKHNIFQNTVLIITVKILIVHADVLLLATFFSKYKFSTFSTVTMEKFLTSQKNVQLENAKANGEST